MGSQIAMVFVWGAIFVLWVFYFWFYWQYRVEKTRQELFVIRDELFDYAAAGNIPFNHTAYGLLREMMNSMIRFTHKIDWVTLIFLLLALRKALPKEGKYYILLKEIENLPDEAKKEFEKYVFRMNMAVVSHLIKGSIFLMCITIVFALIILSRQGLNIFHQGVQNLYIEVKRQFPGIEEIDKIAAELG